MSHRTDHYAVLGVARTATRGQIRAAYRRLARQLHPDTSLDDPRSARKFARVSQAWEVLGDASLRKAYDDRGLWGRFAAPGTGGPASFQVEGAGPIYHSDLGHHSDFYQSGDPLTVAEAAVLVRRHPAWLRRAIRTGRLAAAREEGIYLLRRRDVERLDRTTPRRPRRSAEPHETAAAGADATA
jgi:curved DNA-binding protein CbpA